MRNPFKKAFTLIELLVVIAIIAILAAILFPVFANAREKARETTCVSNTKQMLLGIIQYTSDYDEGMPITFKDANSYGPSLAQYNTSPDYAGQQTGIPIEIYPYVKSTQLFQCPDDHQIVSGTGEAADIFTSAPTGTPAAATLVGLYYWQVYGTSYKFTNQNYTHPLLSANPNALLDTGYSAIPYCTTAGGTKCDFTANNEPMSAGSPALGAKATFVPQNAAEYAYAANTFAQSEITLSMFSRPSETRCVGDWEKQWADKPASHGEAFHPVGTMIGFVDGHAKFLVSAGTSYYTGCDGLDWAWDYAGSCNSKMLQRQAD